MKKLLSSLLALAMVLSLAACGNGSSSSAGSAGSAGSASSGGESADPIRIGFFAPVSAASAAADGQSAQQSAELAVKLVNESGGINGRMVELVDYDDGLDTAEAANIAEKLTTADGVAAVVSGSYSGPTKVAAPICQDAGIVMVSAYAVHPDVVNAGEYIFSQSFPGAVQATAAATFAVEDLGAQRIAIVAVDLDFGKEQSAYQILTFIIGTAIAGLAGGIYAHRMGYICSTDFAFVVSIQILSMVVIGGIGTIRGPILGSLLLSVLPEALRFVDDYRSLVYGGLLVLMVRFMPGGLIGNNSPIVNGCKLLAGKVMKKGGSAA